MGTKKKSAKQPAARVVYAMRPEMKRALGASIGAAVGAVVGMAMAENPDGFLKNASEVYEQMKAQGILPKDGPGEPVTSMEDLARDYADGRRPPIVTPAPAPKRKKSK